MPVRSGRPDRDQDKFHISFKNPHTHSKKKHSMRLAYIDLNLGSFGGGFMECLGYSGIASDCPRPESSSHLLGSPATNAAQVGRAARPPVVPAREDALLKRRCCERDEDGRM